MSTTRKKAAGLSALKSLQNPTDTPEETPQEAPATQATPKTSTATPKQKSTTQKPPPQKRATTKATAKPKASNQKSPSPTSKDKVAFSLNMPEEAHARLREIAFHERGNMTQLILEGIDMLFKSKGLPPMSQNKD